MAAELGIGTEVLATRKDVEAIAFGSGAPEDSPLMRGWRREVVGEKLLAARLPLVEPEVRPDIDIAKSIIAGYTQRLSRYRCNNCGFKARQFYWRCPACGGWETSPPRRSEAFDQTL